MRAGSAHIVTGHEAVLMWRTSSRSGTGNGQNCVEVGAWRTSSRSGSGNGSNCVEVGAHSGCGTSIAVRDTKHRTGGTLSLDHTEWLGLTAAVKSGELDA